MRYTPLPIGVDNFEKLITRGYYFVDKTNLIRDLLDMKAEVNLFTRPRRFGKTLNMSMLRYFFEDGRTYDGEPVDRSALFEGLHIMEAGEKYLSHMGRYPVISLTLKSGKQPDFVMSYASLRRQIVDEYRRHEFILQRDILKPDRERYCDIMAEKADQEAYSDALKFLSQCLEKYYGKKAIILIDEYDVPLENAYIRGFYKEMIDFIRALFESSLKTNGSLEFAVITGCLRISRESVFTGMNNLKVISILDEKYDEYFGFTEEEVRSMCDDYHLSHKYETFREWYDGYLFGKAHVYNPWSVIQFMDDLQENEDWFPRSYWANTSSNSIVRSLVDRADESVKGEIEQLIGGGEITKPVHEDITYGEIYDTMDNLWNFLFFTGYLRKVREEMDMGERQRYLTMRIPNAEVEYIFRSKIRSWFQEQIRQRDLGRLHTAFISKDTETFEEEMNDILLETISAMDEYESYYHGLTVGLLTGIRGYITKSNRETGKGRCDLFVKPVSRRKEAFVVEFKVAKNLKELETKAEEALKQIEERQYTRELEDDGYDLISWYGIAFCKKECLVKVREG